MAFGPDSEFISDHIRSIAQVAAHARATHGLDVSEDDVRESLDQFCVDGLAVAEDGKYLGLALPQDR